MPRSPSGSCEFDPYILLMGCRPWPPPPEPDGRCGVCKGNAPADPRDLVCGHCSKSSRSFDRKYLKPSRGRRNSEAGDVADRERRAKESLKAKHGKAPKLSERERRHYWLGVGSRRDPDYNEKRLAARRWLREIGQLPDWSLILDRRGNVIGRVECEPSPESPATPGCSSSPSPSPVTSSAPC